MRTFIFWLGFTATCCGQGGAELGAPAVPIQRSILTELKSLIDRIEMLSDRIAELEGKAEQHRSGPSDDSRPKPASETKSAASPERQPDLGIGTLSTLDERSLFSPDKMRLVGGYRFPHFNTPTTASTGFAWGGGTIATIDGKIHAWCLNNENSKQVVEGVLSVPMGTPDTPPDKWPMLSNGAVWSRSQLFDETGMNGYHLPNGMVFDYESRRLFLSCYSRYDTTPDPPQWIAAVQYPQKTVVSDFAPALPDNLMSVFGGGMMLAPKSWADKHASGHRLCLARGGFPSGQGGSYGPAAAVLTGKSSIKTIMRFAANYEIGKDVADGPPFPTKEKIERGFNDYESHLTWVFSPDGETGYFTGEIRGNPAWLDHPDYKGVIWVLRASKGDLRYEYQTEGGSQTHRNVIYVYDPDDFTKVAHGQLKPDQVRGKFYKLDSQGVPGIARSVIYDQETKLLWVFYTKSWSYYVERHPILAAYKLVE
ncbi:hypothetical protein CKO51_25800 [Rhodopirellula sp. SM50]|nr:hypothetical protein CKO51_25800 [Rhodopirellula sp. SM50]